MFIINDEVSESSIDNLSELVKPEFPYPVEEFVDAVKNNRPPLVSIEEARWSVELITGVYRAAREGRRITV